MSNQMRKINRLKEANLRKSWQAWLATVKALSLGQRLTIAYQIVPGLRIAAQLSILLIVVVIALVWLLVGFNWPELSGGI